MSSSVEYHLRHRSTAELISYPYSYANGAFSNLLLPAIIVLNRRYYPNKHGSAATVGTEALSMSIAQAFKSMKVFCGLILYQRDETINEPTITIQVINFNLCAILAFNFNMNPPWCGEGHLSCCWYAHEGLWLRRHSHALSSDRHPTGIPSP